jgi:hypothetical protein
MYTTLGIADNNFLDLEFSEMDKTAHCTVFDVFD